MAFSGRAAHTRPAGSRRGPRRRRNQPLHQRGIVPRSSAIVATGSRCRCCDLRGHRGDSRSCPSRCTAALSTSARLGGRRVLRRDLPGQHLTVRERNSRLRPGLRCGPLHPPVVPASPGRVGAVVHRRVVELASQIHLSAVRDHSPGRSNSWTPTRPRTSGCSSVRGSPPAPGIGDEQSPSVRAPRSVNSTRYEGLSDRVGHRRQPPELSPNEP